MKQNAQLKNTCSGRESVTRAVLRPLVVLTENIRIGGFDKAHHLQAWPERAKRGINGNLWSRETATMSYPCDACEEKLPCSVDVLPGRASAIHATRGDGSGRLEGASSEQLWQGAQHSRRACSFRHVPVVHRKTRQQGWSESLELFHFSVHVFHRLWSERGVFQGATCDGANTLPKWQRETHGGFLFAGK